MKSSVYLHFYRPPSTWATLPNFYKKILIPHFMIFQKSQTPTNKGFILWILHMIPWNSSNGEIDKGYIWVWSSISDISRPFGRPVYRFGCPKPYTQKTLFTLSFFSCFNKKFVEVAVSDFTMYLNYFEMA